MPKFLRAYRVVLTDQELSPLFLDKNGKVIQSGEATDLNDTIFEKTFVNLDRLKKWSPLIVSWNKLRASNNEPDVRWVKLSCKIIKVEEL